MHIEAVRQYCLRKSMVTEGFPFDESTLVFKVAGKIFLIAALDEWPRRFNVKCHPELAQSLRETYEETVLPGYHMNKNNWNTIVCDGALNDQQLLDMIDHSYVEVVKTLPKKVRITIE
ncbi:MAG: MmcQ/YjbR family DNA-binding protein [Bacteroidota bacterium]